MIDVVIVNWNSGFQLRDCLVSLRDFCLGEVSSVVVVDNDSVDESLVALRSEGDWPFELRVIKNSVNVGFGAACNQGSVGKGKYLLFLNPDARVYANTVKRPLVFLENPVNSKIGIVGVQLRDEFGRVSHSCSRFPKVIFFVSQMFGINRLRRFRRFSQVMAEWAHDETREVDQVMGAFFLIRRELFEDLGGFDERYFVYFEEVDLSYRAFQKGWKTVFISDVHAFHAAGGTSRQVKAHRLFYSLRSRLLYGFKHFSTLNAFLLAGLTLCVEPVTRSLLSLSRGELDSVRNTLRGYGMLYRDLPALIAKVRER